MTLADKLTPERVVADMQSDEHWPAVVELVEHLVAVGALSEELKASALTALKAREEKSSTGIGGGIAIPHCFLPGLDEVVAVLGRSRDGIDFCAVDQASVHLVVLFMVPPDQHSLHLKTLAAIAKTLNSAQTREELREAPNEEQILSIFRNKEALA